MTGRFLFRVLVVGSLLLGGLACEGEDDGETISQPKQKLPPRYARQYLPFKPVWVGEHRIPVAPQKSPQMVIWEVSEFDPRIPATPEQEQAGADFVQACFDAAVANGWFDREKGMADGFLNPGSDLLHHRNDRFTLDDIQLDANRPEYLMYYPDPDQEGEFVLAGFMFFVNKPLARGRQFAGPLANWHYHKYVHARCWESGLLSTGMINREGVCTTGGIPLNRSPEMVHVWLIDHPGGRFSTGMTLPTHILKAGLAKRRAEHGM